MPSRAVSSLISSDHTPMLLLLLLGRVWLARRHHLVAGSGAVACDAMRYHAMPSSQPG
jgi:hypothetical protein